ncbi:hypothetical protein CAMRE0001_0017 [Campylobacter rectus RM3267]|uniref:Uncharacterized protein n=1 Tax=Campylobacter rectus RM3267 TaxID=553218 RepID=B9D3G3_CAMRE|nr:hypothetical protein CAMRE0001_0017 [Campylobacter rectus RM3267]
MAWRCILRVCVTFYTKISLVLQRSRVRINLKFNRAAF